MDGVTNPAEAFFKDGAWGWDGTKWRKNPLIWGYSDAYCVRLAEDDADAGVNVLSADAVPAGIVRTITSIVCLDENTAITYLQSGFSRGATFILIGRYYPTAAGEVASWVCNIVLKEGDILSLTFAGCGALDNLRAYFSGYDMSIIE